jgi:hypothetical protein
MFEKIIKKLFGDRNDELALQQQLKEAQLSKQQAIKKRKVRQPKVKEEVVQTPLTPKEIATLKKEPWVDVIGFKVNKQNVRNGFFELDWNEFWVEKLKQDGYGYEGDPEDEIVGRWYRDICYNAAAAEGIDVSDQDFGFLKINKTQ